MMWQDLKSHSVRMRPGFAATILRMALASATVGFSLGKFWIFGLREDSCPIPVSKVNVVCTQPSGPGANPSTYVPRIFVSPRYSITLR